MSSFGISRLSGGVYLLAVFYLLALLQSVLAANPISFCKCVCGPEHHIIPLPRDPQYPIFGGSSKACGACSKQFCLDQYSDMCKAVGTGEGDELVTSCFGKNHVATDTVHSEHRRAQGSPWMQKIKETETHLGSMNLNPS
ncbi:unnamed protein product [Mortierella alpina]